MADEQKSHVPENWGKTAAIGHHLLIFNIYLVPGPWTKWLIYRAARHFLYKNQIPIHKT